VLDCACDISHQSGCRSSLIARVQFPAPWSEGWLKASGLKSAVNTPLLAAGCFILMIGPDFRDHALEMFRGISSSHCWILLC
jgi:hypothetical protein